MGTKEAIGEDPIGFATRNGVTNLGGLDIETMLYKIDRYRKGTNQKFGFEKATKQSIVSELTKHIPFGSLHTIIDGVPFNEDGIVPVLHLTSHFR